MSDKADDLILQMQHLEASARAAEKARAGNLGADKLKTRALKLAAAAQAELAEAQKKLTEGEDKLAHARQPGVEPRLAGELFGEGRALVEQNKPLVVKARAKLNFARDAMDEADRRAWEALQADAQAEAHAQLAEELRPGGAISTSSAFPAAAGAARSDSDPTDKAP